MQSCHHEPPLLGARDLRLLPITTKASITLTTPITTRAPTTVEERGFSPALLAPKISGL